MLNCITEASFSMIINGSAKREVSTIKEIKIGVPTLTSSFLDMFKSIILSDQ